MRVYALVLAGILFSGTSWSALAAARGVAELGEREMISKAAQHAFFAEDFETLESTSRQYRLQQSRTSSGLWKLTLFYAGLDEALDIPSDASDPAVRFKVLEPRLRRWQQRYPNSPVAHIALSLLHINLAWAYRGDGLADSVKEDAWMPFRQNIELARQNLETQKLIAAVDPRWYETMLIIARAQGWQRERFYSVLEEALQKEPLFYQTYFAAISYLLPKWHGDVTEIEDFARAAVERTSRLEGEGMYARIYWYVSQAQFRMRIFDRTEVIWPNMKQGFDAVVEKYPDAWNLNHYAKFACLARDKETTRDLMDKVQSSVVDQVWQPVQFWEGCWDWSH